MMPQRQLLPIEHWTPDQACVVFEFLDDLRELIWNAHGHAIQQSTREDRVTPKHTDDNF
jgi:hypothetical protein